MCCVLSVAIISRTTAMFLLCQSPNLLLNRIKPCSETTGICSLVLNVGHIPSVPAPRFDGPIDAH
jgi:hypothetical protein